jgi:hypothetical protein
MVVLLVAQPPAHVVNALVAVGAFGLLMGAIGHLVRSRTLVLTGILILGLVFVYWLLRGFGLVASGS